MNTHPDPALIDDLVLANHILVNQGVLDGFGHISVRDPANPQRFFIARSMAPALVQADDIVVCDLDSNVIDERGRKTYLERFIHGEIFKLRPDVNSVIHSHSPSVIPFGVTGARLRPICHMSGFLGATTPVYEIRHFAGEDSDLLVRSHALGKALAEVLGSHAVALMRGHGSVAVGSSIKQVVYRAIYAEVNAKLQLAANGLGEISFLNEEEAQLSSDMNDGQIPRSWNLWVTRLGHVDLGA
jgi:HCOMODA/2-hydroxy-3-carboxy-muconic semialdehyde decarboxylase